MLKVVKRRLPVSGPYPAQIVYDVHDSQGWLVCFPGGELDGSFNETKAQLQAEAFIREVT